MSDDTVGDIRNLQGFSFGHLNAKATVAPAPFAAAAAPGPAAVTGVPPLGPLEQFVGSWTGLGFNTIFRPSQPATGSDNVLQLNLTTESLVFSAGLGSIPNRGEVQPDIFFNGVSYLQTVNDITNPGQSVGIHFEPGLWIFVPPTTNPAIPSPSLVRMGSIPHGTTILAQGTFTSNPGGPSIPLVNITPAGVPKFASQTASDPGTPRIPKVLPVPGTSLSVTDWQNLLDDPNSFIRNSSLTQSITNTIEISIASTPASPLFGGGIQDIAFLIGSAAPNANANQFRATFWIETVNFTLPIPVMAAGTSVTLSPTTTVAGLPLPQFAVQTNSDITAATTVSVSYNQIQYSQFVILTFAGLDWPHVSVATLVPASPVTVQLP